MAIAAAAGTWMAANAATIAAVTAAATTAMSLNQQRQNTKVQEQQAEMQKQNALEEMRQNYAALNTEQAKMSAQEIDASLENQKAYVQDAGRVNLMAASTGMGGQSIGDMFYQVEQKKAQNLDNLLLNHEAGMQELTQQAENLQAGAKSRLTGLTVSKPSAAAGILNIGTSALGGYLQGKELQKTFEDYSGSSLKGGV